MTREEFRMELDRIVTDYTADVAHLTATVGCGSTPAQFAHMRQMWDAAEARCHARIDAVTAKKMAA